MKKIWKVLAVTMIMALGIFTLAACGSESKYVGTWEAVKMSAYGISMTPEEAGMTFTIELKKNGKAEATTNGEADGEGEWEETDDGILITDTTGQEITAVINDDGQLEFELSGVKFIMEKK